jgi:uncharacterized protein with ParB-like and HNH nuclease domain
MMAEQVLFEDSDDLPEDEVQEIPKEIRRLKIETFDYPVEVIVKKIQENDIILRPEYQRNFVWDRKKSISLIESILLNIPLPPIYLTEEDDSSFSVIDGLQRLHTFLDYYEDKFSLNGLKGEGLIELNKQTYSGLVKNFPKAKRILNKGIIRIIVINKDSHPDIKYDIFEKLNSGSTKLNDQEVRNCIYHGSLNSLIMGSYDKDNQTYKKNGLRHNNILQKAMNLEEAHSRYLDAEVVLRILAIIKYGNDIDTKYKSSMKLLINLYMNENKNLNDALLQDVKNLFDDTITKIYQVFVDKSFKRFHKDDIEKSLNRSIMDCLVFSFSNYSLESLIANKEAIVNKMDDMLNDGSNNYIYHDDIYSIDLSFKESVTNWTSSKSRLKARLSLWSKSLKEIIGY